MCTFSVTVYHKFCSLMHSFHSFIKTSAIDALVTFDEEESTGIMNNLYGLHNSFIDLMITADLIYAWISSWEEEEGCLHEQAGCADYFCHDEGIMYIGKPRLSWISWFKSCIYIWLFPSVGLFPSASFVPAQWFLVAQSWSTGDCVCDNCWLI